MNEQQTPPNHLAISALLRDPAGAVEHARESGRFWSLMAFLAGTTMVGSGLFGFALGAFVDLQVAALDALKMMGVVAFAFALCYPTFYVFACIGGSTLGPLRLLAFGLVCTATMGCLLAALAPILWIFAVSTETLAFIVVFAGILAGAALAFAYRPIDGAVAKGVVTSDIGLKLWFALFFIVALQTITLVRPMLAPVGSESVPEGKCFFIQHFARTVLGVDK